MAQQVIDKYLLDNPKILEQVRRDVAKDVASQQGLTDQTLGPSFLIGPFHWRRMPGKAKSGRSSAGFSANQCQLAASLRRARKRRWPAPAALLETVLPERRLDLVVAGIADALWRITLAQQHKTPAAQGEFAYAVLALLDDRRRVAGKMAGSASNAAMRLSDRRNLRARSARRVLTL